MVVDVADSFKGTELALMQAIQKSGEPKFTFLFCTDQHEPEQVFQAFVEETHLTLDGKL